MENNKQWAGGGECRGVTCLIIFFLFYALLATSFLLTIWHAQQRGARLYVCTFIMALTAL